MDPRTEQLLARRGAEATVSARPKSALVRWVDAHRTITASVVAAIAVIAVAGRYALVTLPAQQADEIARAEQAAGQRKAADDLAGAEGLEACMATALGTHRVAWDQACHGRKRGPNCTLPRPEAAQLDELDRQARAQCLKQYSIR
jgi:hypothetical protein